MSSPRGGSPGRGVHVPGAKAPEIDVPAFVNSWPRLMLKCSGRLSSFLHGILSGTPLHYVEETPVHALWPVPLPYPEVFRSGADGSTAWKKRRLCLQLVVLNWLYLGQVGGPPSTLRLGRKLSPGQWRIVRLLESLAEDANSVQKVDAMGMGRSAAKAETQDDEVAALHRALLQVQQSSSFYGADRSSFSSRPADAEEPRFSGEVLGKLQAKPFVTAKPIEADLLLTPCPTWIAKPQPCTWSPVFSTELKLILRRKSPSGRPRAKSSVSMRSWPPRAGCGCWSLQKWRSSTPLVSLQW